MPLKYKRIRAERQPPLSEDQKTRRRYAMLLLKLCADRISPQRPYVGMDFWEYGVLQIC